MNWLLKNARKEWKKSFVSTNIATVSRALPSGCVWVIPVGCSQGRCSLLPESPVLTCYHLALIFRQICVCLLYNGKCHCFSLALKINTFTCIEMCVSSVQFDVWQIYKYTLPGSQSKYRPFPILQTFALCLHLVNPYIPSVTTVFRFCFIVIFFFLNTEFQEN